MHTTVIVLLALLLVFLIVTQYLRSRRVKDPQQDEWKVMRARYRAAVKAWEDAGKK